MVWSVMPKVSFKDNGCVKQLLSWLFSLLLNYVPWVDCLNWSCYHEATCCQRYLPLLSFCHCNRNNARNALLYARMLLFHLDECCSCSCAQTSPVVSSSSSCWKEGTHCTSTQCVSRYLRGPVGLVHNGVDSKDTVSMSTNRIQVYLLACCDPDRKSSVERADPSALSKSEGDVWRILWFKPIQDCDNWTMILLY